MSIQKFIVSKDEAIYEAWPDLVQTDSGKLICVLMECTHHGNRDGARIMITESTDRGRTWSPKKALTEKGVRDNYFNCARISKLRDGRLAIICDLHKGPGRENEATTYIWYGDGEGLSWSEPVILPFRGIVPDKLLQLKNGRILLSNHGRNEETKQLEQHLWYSDDNGETWSEQITLAADDRYNLCEVSILECPNGTLVAFLRENSFKGWDMLKTISYDNGETWSELYPMPIDGGHRPVAGFLNDGSVMITYRFIPSSFQNTFAAFLNPEDLEKTERQHPVRILPLDYDRHPVPDGGYTGWTQFEDGEIYVVNYIKDDSDKAQIRGYSFYPEDVILPAKQEETPGFFKNA